MASERLSTAQRETKPSRRRLLATLGAAASVSIAGCGGFLPGNGSTDTVERSEVIVENGTTSTVEIAVHVTDREDETLFSRVFTLGPEQMVGGDAIKTTPSRVHAFTPDGVSKTWRYDPGLPADFDCEIKDVGLTLNSNNTIEPWYDC